MRQWLYDRFLSCMHREIRYQFAQINKETLHYLTFKTDSTWCSLTCVDAGVLLHAPLAHKRLLTVFTLELFGDVVQRPVHLQTVFVGERLATDLAGVRPHSCVIQHVYPQGVQLR